MGSEVPSGPEFLEFSHFSQEVLLGFLHFVLLSRFSFFFSRMRPFSLFPLFPSHVYCAGQGLPLEKPCLALLYLDWSGPMLVTWGLPFLIHCPRGPDLWIRGEKESKGSGNSVNCHSFSSCRDWRSVWHLLVSRLSYVAVQPRQSRAFFFFFLHMRERFRKNKLISRRHFFKI